MQIFRNFLRGLLVLGLAGAATGALAQDAPDALVRNVSQEVFTIAKSDPKVQAGDQARIREVVDGEGDDAEMDVAADDEPEPASRAFIPGVDELPEGQKLVADQSAYHMFHQMNVTWPCLSFDFLRDHLGPARQTFPHTAYLVAGTQADIAKNNEVLVLKASSMYRTSKDDGTCSARGDDALRHLTDMHLHMSKNPRYLLNLLSHAQSS